MHVKFSRQFLTRIESQVHCPAFSLADPADTLLKIRALQSFDRSARRYAVQRTVRCAVRVGP